MMKRKKLTKTEAVRLQRHLRSIKHLTEVYKAFFRWCIEKPFHANEIKQRKYLRKNREKLLADIEKYKIDTGTHKKIYEPDK